MMASMKGLAAAIRPLLLQIRFNSFATPSHVCSKVYTWLALAIVSQGVHVIYSLYLFLYFLCHPYILTGRNLLFLV